MTDRYENRTEEGGSVRSRGAWVRALLTRVRRDADEEVPFELKRGFDLDHWLAASGGIPAGLVNRPPRKPVESTGLRGRPVMSMTLVVLILMAGFVAAANISMPGGAIGGPADNAAAAPTSTPPETANGGSDSPGTATVAPTATASTAADGEAGSASPTATARPSGSSGPGPSSNGNDPVDDLVNTVDDTVDDTSDTVNDTVDDTSDTVNETNETVNDTMDSSL